MNKISYNHTLTNDNKGYIYILSNISIPNQLKIGLTQRTPEERCKELSSATGVPTKYKIEYSLFFHDCKIAEKLIHNHFEKLNKRVNNNREFFFVSLDESISFIKELHKKLHNDYKLTPKIINEELNESRKLIEKKDYNNAIINLELLFLDGNYIAAYLIGYCYELLSKQTKGKEYKKELLIKSLIYYKYTIDFCYIPVFNRAYFVCFQLSDYKKCDLIIINFCRLITDKKIRLSINDINMLTHFLKYNLPLSKTKKKKIKILKNNNKVWKMYRRQILNKMNKKNNTEVIVFLSKKNKYSKYLFFMAFLLLLFFYFYKNNKSILEYIVYYYPVFIKKINFFIETLI